MKRFSIVSNGYDINEVNRFIDIVIDRIDKLNGNIKYYQDKVSKLERELDEVRNKSGFTSEIIDDTKNNANTIIHEALLKVDKAKAEEELILKNINLCKKRVKSLLEEELKLMDEFRSNTSGGIK